jgi:tetratricopeptide (TPR) repeat protein
LRATIDWSYDLLTPAEAALFRTLAVFAGGWTIEAAEAVMGGGTVHQSTFDLLHQLVNKSLVVVAGEEEMIRYRMLETLREYAREKLVAQGEEVTVCEQHAVYFLQLAEAARPLLYSAEQQVWYQRLIIEQSNFQAALEWWRVNENYSQVTQLGAALCWFWLRHGELREEMPHLEWALAAVNLNHATTPPAVRTKALYSVGTGASWSGDLSRARHLFEACLQVEEAPDAWFELSEVLGALANIAEWEGDYPRATRLTERYLALSRTYNFTQGVADSLARLGELARLQGDYAKAGQLLRESLALRKAVGTATGIVSTQGYLSMVVRELGDFVEAQQLLEEALQLSSALESKMFIAGVTTELGVVAQLRYDYEKANAHQQHALMLISELGFQAYRTLVLTRLGNLALIQNELESARAYFVESLEVCRQSGSQRSVAAGLEGLAGVAARCGRVHQAAHLCGAAAACRQKTGLVRPIEERAPYKQTITLARAALDDSQFDAAFSTGKTMALHDLVTQALGMAEHFASTGIASDPDGDAILAADAGSFTEQMLSAMPVDEASPRRLGMIGKELFEPAGALTTDDPIGEGGP